MPKAVEGQPAVAAAEEGQAATTKAATTKAAATTAAGADTAATAAFEVRPRAKRALRQPGQASGAEGTAENQQPPAAAAHAQQELVSRSVSMVKTQVTPPNTAPPPAFLIHIDIA